MENYTLQSILAGIHYFRCHDYIELLATVHTLTSFVKKHPKVGTVTAGMKSFDQNCWKYVQRLSRDCVVIHNIKEYRCNDDNDSNDKREW